MAEVDETKCRVCFHNIEQIIVAFSNLEPCTRILYAEIYSYVAGLMPGIGSHVMCWGCATELISAYKFKKKVEKSEERWKSRIKRDTDEIIERYTEKHEIEHIDTYNDDQEFVGLDDNLQLEWSDDEIDYKPETNKEMANFCSLCDISFTSRSTFERHLKRLHQESDIEEEEEEDAKPVLSIQEDSDVEMNKDDDEIGPDHFTMTRCLYCETLLAHRDSLLRHIRKKHSDEMLNCPHCPNRYCLEDQLAKHLKSKHKEHSVKTNVKKESEDAEFQSSKNHEKIKSESDPEWADTEENYVSGETSSNVKLPCEDCDITFSHRQSLLRHMRNKHGRQPEQNYVPSETSSNANLTCEDCGASFAQRQSLLRHMRNKHGRQPEKKYVSGETSSIDNLTCEDCGATFAQRQSLLRHMRTKHGPQTEENYDSDEVGSTIKHPCEDCDQTFAQRQSLLRHMRNKHGRQTEKNYVSGETSSIVGLTCEDCDVTFAQRQSLLRHMRNKHGRLTHPESQQGNLGNQSEKKIKIERTGQLHVKKPKKTEYICEYCNEKLETYKLYQKHKREIHPYKKRKVMCPHCGKLVLLKYMDSHIQELHGPAGQFICDHCGILKTTKRRLLRHLKFKHFPVSMKCRFCDQVFKNRGIKYTHELRVHIPERIKHECPYCKHRFIKKQLLVAHITTHTGIKRFICNECGFQTSSNSLLRRHMASHSEDRSHICSICSAAFKTSKTLYVHKKIHKEFEYECPVCARQFIANQALRIHISKNHPEYELPPPGTVMNKNALKKEALNMLLKMTDQPVPAPETS